MMSCPTWCEVTYPHTTIHRAVMPADPGGARVEVFQVGGRAAEVVTTTYGPYGRVTKTRHAPEAARALGEETYTAAHAAGDAAALDHGCWLVIAADTADGRDDLLADLLADLDPAELWLAPAPAGGAR